MKNNKQTSQTTSKKFLLHNRKQTQQLKTSPRPRLRHSSSNTALLASKTNILKKSSIMKKQKQERQVIQVWAPQTPIADNLYQFKKGLFSTLQISSNLEKFSTEIFILTSIEEFAKYFVVFQQQREIKCKLWFIFSKAMNSNQVQCNFNNMYSPLKFHFISQFSDFYDHLLHPYPEITTIVPESVISFGKNYSQYSCIQQFAVKNFTQIKFQQSCLFLLDNHELNFLNGDEKLVPYFLKKEDKFKENGSIEIKIQKRKGKIILLLQNATEQKIKNMKLTYYEEHFTQNSKLNHILLNLSLHHQTYINKILNNHISTNQPVLLLENHLKEKNKSEIFNELKSHNILFINASCSINYTTLQCFKLVKSPKNYHEISIESSFQVLEQLPKIIKYIDECKELKKLYESEKPRIKKVIVKIYSSELREHFLVKVLESIGITIELIENLEEIYETHKIMIIFGKFRYRDFELIQDYSNIFTVLWDPSPENPNKTQIQESKNFLQILSKAYDKFYNEESVPSIETYVDIVAKKKETAQMLNEVLNVNKRILQIWEKQQFMKAINQFSELSKHIVVVMMDEFTEELQNAIKNAKWVKNHLVSFEIYIKYGGQFIFRNQAQDYKFIKTHELKEKIAFLSENLQVPMPYAPPPEPITEEELKEEEVQEGGQYQLYICIHRSVPHHSFISRSKKIYHILIYNKFEEVLFLARHLKQSERILVIANLNSQKIYKIACKKMRISEEKLSITYFNNPSESCIRKFIDSVLRQYNLRIMDNSDQFFKKKKFKALVIYSAQKQKHCKIVRTIQKVFGTQLKLQFMTDSIFEQISSHRFQFIFDNSATLYKLGTENSLTGTCIRNVKELFVLAMHPDLQELELSINHLAIPIYIYLSKLIYGNKNKNYEVKKKQNENVRNRFLKAVKSEKQIEKQFDLSEARSVIKTSSVQKKRKSFTNLNSTIKYQGNDTPISIISSKSLGKVQKHSYFQCEVELIQKLVHFQQQNHLSLVLLQEAEFQTFGIFECKNVSEAYPGIIWIIVTKGTGKCLFMNKSIIYCPPHKINELIDQIYQEYINITHFNCLQVDSDLDSIQHGKYCSDSTANQKKILSIWASSKKKKNSLTSISSLLLCQSYFEPKTNENNILYFSCSNEISMIVEKLIQKFNGKEKKNKIQIRLGTLILCPESSSDFMKKVIGIMNQPKILIRTYSKNTFLQCLMRFSFMKMVIILSKDMEDKYAIGSLQNSIYLENSTKKMAHSLTSILKFK